VALLPALWGPCYHSRGAPSPDHPGDLLHKSASVSRAQQYVLDRFEKAGEKGENVLSNEERQAALHALNHAAYKLEPPLHELEHALHPWVVFAIMPIFALANVCQELVEARMLPLYCSGCNARLVGSGLRFYLS
jgi:Na+/H+ antiporter 1